MEIALSEMIVIYVRVWSFENCFFTITRLMGNVTHTDASELIKLRNCEAFLSDEVHLRIQLKYS